MQNVLHKLVYNNPDHLTLPVDPVMRIAEKSSKSSVIIFFQNIFSGLFA